MFNNFTFFPSVPVHELALEAGDSPLWDWLNVRKMFPGTTHKGARDLIMRFQRLEGHDLTYQDVADDLNVVDYFPWSRLPLCARWAQDLAIENNTSLGRVMLAELAPKFNLGMHQDEGKYAEAYTRYHVCLTGNCEFYCGGERITTEPGLVFSFRKELPHKAWNWSAHIPRIHLIVDLRG